MGSHGGEVRAIVKEIPVDGIGMYRHRTTSGRAISNGCQELRLLLLLLLFLLPRTGKTERTLALVRRHRVPCIIFEGELNVSSRAISYVIYRFTLTIKNTFISIKILKAYIDHTYPTNYYFQYSLVFVI